MGQGSTAGVVPNNVGAPPPGRLAAGSCSNSVSTPLILRYIKIYLFFFGLLFRCVVTQQLHCIWNFSNAQNHFGWMCFVHFRRHVDTYCVIMIAFGITTNMYLSCDSSAQHSESQGKTASSTNGQKFCCLSVSVCVSVSVCGFLWLSVSFCVPLCLPVSVTVSVSVIRYLLSVVSLCVSCVSRVCLVCVSCVSLLCLCVSLCVAVCLCVSLCVAVCLCVSLCVSVCLCLSLCLSVSLCVSLAKIIKHRAPFFNICVFVSIVAVKTKGKSLNSANKVDK